MDVTTRTETIPSHDGGSFHAHVATPAVATAGQTSAGILLLQEALGVNDYIREVAARLAGLGYVVLAPDMYWRIEPDVDLNREDDFGRAMELLGRFDPGLGAADMNTSLTHLAALPECGGKVGALGFCMGGRLAYSAAVESSPDCVVSYYGVGIDQALDRVADITCPALFHFGRRDPFIAPDAVERITAAFAGRGDVEVVLHDAGHAFDNHMAPSMYSAGAAAAAWDKTVAFLAANL
jgi:carboxymethylenebutenolidase